MKSNPSRPGSRAASSAPAFTQEELRAHIAACAHPACKATEGLRRVGARLVLGKGRHCEIAAVAAVGEAGLAPREVVAQRRSYAAHLGIRLAGTVQDSEDPAHIAHAIENVPGNPGARFPIDLGKARARFEGGRYSVRGVPDGR